MVRELRVGDMVILRKDFTDDSVHKYFAWEILRLICRIKLFITALGCAEG